MITRTSAVLNQLFDELLRTSSFPARQPPLAPVGANTESSIIFLRSLLTIWELLGIYADEREIVKMTDAAQGKRASGSNASDKAKPVADLSAVVG
jgi:hypothetical protein